MIPPSTVASNWEIDATGIVERVMDGDTFHAVPLGRVRLADIDTPEVGEPGAQEATDCLTSLVYRRLVYLDVDDLHGRTFTDASSPWSTSAITRRTCST